MSNRILAIFGHEHDSLIGVLIYRIFERINCGLARCHLGEPYLKRLHIDLPMSRNMISDVKIHNCEIESSDESLEIISIWVPEDKIPHVETDRSRGKMSVPSMNKGFVMLGH